MLNLFKVVVITNLLAALTVFILSKYTTAFNSTGLMDFLFFIVIIIWGVARLTWEGSSQSRNWSLDPAANKPIEWFQVMILSLTFMNKKDRTINLV